MLDSSCLVVSDKLSYKLKGTNDSEGKQSFLLCWLNLIAVSSEKQEMPKL